jgi:Glucodextranase, domain B
MGSPRSRTSLVVLVATLTCLVGAATAHAAFTGSSISTPGNGAELFYDGDNGSGSVNVRGTVASPTAGARGDILCYTVSNTSSTKVASGVDVSSGSFAASVSLAPIAGEACRLAMVPAGTTPTGSAATAFGGPAVSVSDRFSHSSNGNLYGYYILSGTLAWSFAMQSLGDCPVFASYATDPATLGSFSLLAGNACLPRRSGVGAASGTRSALQIDGANAYPPAAISSLTGLAGFEPLSYSASFDASHDTVTINESDVPTICDPPGGYPPTASNCPSLHDSGILVTQTTTLRPGGQAVRVQQVFKSVDGRAHALDLLFGQSVGDPSSGSSPGFVFPGQTSIATHATPDSFTSFPSGPGTIVVDREAASAPSTANPTGGITYSRPPTSADFVSSPGASVATFLMHYADIVPAGGSISYSWSFTQAASASQLATLDAIERDRFAVPRLTIARPHRHAVSRTYSVVVRGRATDAVGIAAVQIAGKPVAVARDGSFVARVDVRHRRNTINVTAINVGGVAVSTTLHVRYRPEACVVPRLRGLALGRAEDRLRGRDCTFRVRRLHSRGVRAGRVITARPGAGTRRGPRARITLLVSRGR